VVGISNVFDTRARGAPHSGQNLNDGVTDVPHDMHLSVAGSGRMRARMPASASRISLADAYRSDGCLASAFAITASSSRGMLSRRAVRFVGCALRWFVRISVVVPAKNGVFSASSS
jgi:hypothetical protein